MIDIRRNNITSSGIIHLVESTHLKTIMFAGYYGAFNHDDATKDFVTALLHKNVTVQELPAGIDHLAFLDMRRLVRNILARNRNLNHVSFALGTTTTTTARSSPE